MNDDETQNELDSIPCIPEGLSTRWGTIELVNKLTQAEFRILAHLMQGLTNKGIARELAISSNTVKRHVENIYTKFGSSNAFVNKRSHAISVGFNWLYLYAETLNSIQPERDVHGGDNG